jgi:ubiquitin-conjugating enzyme (huntingtin interacting protein 2)
LDILKDQWSPALTLKTALLSLQALLSAPAPDDPQDAVVAQQYLRDYSTFSATARYWTEAFAKNSSTGMEEKVLLLRSTHIYCSSGYTEVVDTVVKYSILQSQVQKLVEMGFPEDMVRSVLKSVNGDENMALEKLCSG